MNFSWKRTRFDNYFPIPPVSNVDVNATLEENSWNYTQITHQNEEVTDGGGGRMELHMNGLMWYEYHSTQSWHGMEAAL